MKEVVLTKGVRTPVGNFGGALRDIIAQELLRIVFEEEIKVIYSEKVFYYGR